MADRSRTFTWGDPSALLEQAHELSGLEQMRAVFTGELPVPPIGRLLDFNGVEFEHGRAVFEFEPAEYHMNPIGSVHGGVSMTLLDSAMSCAVHTTLPAGVAYTTLEVKTNFVRAITLGTGRMVCTGTVVHGGSRVATAEGRLEDDGGKLYAHGTTTCLVFR